MLIKKLLVVIMFIALTSNVSICFASVQQEYKAANQLYSEKKYNEAIAAYEAILASNHLSADIYYNLGNAYFKNNELAPAILNYERALKLKPDHEDALFNLKLVNTKTVDKVDRLPSLFIGNAWQNLVTSKTITHWAYLSIGLMFIALVLFISYLFVGIVLVKKVGFYGGSFFLILSLFGWLMAAQHTSLLQNKTEAIVFSSVTTVVSEPNENSNKLFTLHEGLKVNLIEHTKDWSKIKIPNGNVGWVKSKEIEEI